MDNKNIRTINYTAYDFESLRLELISYIKETNSFKDIDVMGSNIRTYTDIAAYVGQLFGYYINSAANEIFQPTAKKYKNIIKFAELLRYEARGVTSSKVDVIASLSSEYVMSKNGQQIEIPAYSIFPSAKPTVNTNKNFQFTNIEPVNYIIKSYGVRPLEFSDITYRGQSLPFTAPASYFTNDNQISYLSDGFSIPLSIYKPLRILNKNDISNYRGYDTANYPLVSPSNSSSTGQPFRITINTLNYGSNLLPNVEYYLLFNYNQSNSQTYLTVTDNISNIGEKENDVIVSFMLQPTDNTNSFYTIKLLDTYTFNRFYVGNTGIQNLESVSLEYDTMTNRPKSVEKIKLIINKDGSKPPLGVLVEGKIYTFSSGTIESSKIKPDFWDRGIPEYNVLLTINNPDLPNINYGAKLDITSNQPSSNQIIIGKIFTKFIDPITGTPTLLTTGGNRFGDFQVVSNLQTKSTVQKAGTVSFSSGTYKSKVIFNKPFSNATYQINLSSTSNIRKWYASQSINGFTIYIEPNSNFSGDINWIATETIEPNIKEMKVIFNSPLSEVIENNVPVSNYMVMLTPNDNIEVWYENLTANGFTIKSNRNFIGKVSWSAYNYLDSQIPLESLNSNKQSGRLVLSKTDIINGYDIKFKNLISDNNYSIQLVSNRNILLWYTNKSSSGFTINAEQSSDDNDIIVDWYVDFSEDYTYQKHGEILFSDQNTLNNQIPGFLFINIPETFKIDNLYEGSPAISHINANSVIDSSTNGFDLYLDPSRTYERDIKFIIGNNQISTNSIRVFVKNKEGNWDEWQRSGFTTNTSFYPGEKIFKLTMSSSEKLSIEFGDTVHWGTSILDSEVLIIGLNSVGSEGNITKNTLSTNVILSQYILGNDVTSIEFEQNLVNLIGLKSKLYFNGNNVETRIIDTENTKLKTSDITIVQNKNSFGGNDVETADELRQNSSNFFVTQNRLVSIPDYVKYISVAFTDYLVKSKVFSYEEAKLKSLIPQNDLANYWFNHIFVIGLNKDGSNYINKNLRDYLKSQLDNNIFKMSGTKVEIFAASWVPIDVAIRYKKNRNGSSQVIETQIRKNLEEYFSDLSQHNLGEKINHSKISSLINTENIDSFEVMLNKDPDNKLSASDYNVDFRTSDSDVNVARRNKLMELVAKDPSLVKIYQPLFDTLNIDGTREWNYSLDIQLSEFEFPKLGDVIIERE
jgi:hypothetical protein